MVIIKDFSVESLEEANKLVAILRDNTQLLIVNGVNIEAKNVAYIQFKKGPCESCLIAILVAGITLEVEVESCETIVVEKYYDEVENTLEIDVSAE
jgi:deoxycytidylate deaminase